jgi:hypothetical protein
MNDWEALGILTVIFLISSILGNAIGNWMRDRVGRRPQKLKLVEVISERELASRFLNAPNSPLWEATLAALDLQVQEELDTTLEESLTNEQLRYRVGGVAGLLRFKANLQDRERQARQTESEQEETEKAEGN